MEAAKGSSVQMQQGRAPAPLMRAARLHVKSGPFHIDQVARPTPRASDVVVEVKACGIVPNLQNVIGWDDFVATIPPLPAIFGLDAAGVVAEKGELVHGLEIGDRVYVNPLRSCGTCRYCVMGEPAVCDAMTLNGYFGMGKNSKQTFEDYPYGGFSEYMTAPASSLVRLTDAISFEQASRFGYLGTAYNALSRANVDINSTVLINGASGTLGLGGVMFALARGAPKVLAVGRDLKLLERVRAIDPRRIHIHSTRNSDMSVADWARSLTGGNGADVVVDMLPTGAPLEAFQAAFEALGKCGRHVNCGGMFDYVPIYTPVFIQRALTMIGADWFTTAQGQEMVEFVTSGQVDLGIFEFRGYPLGEINTALSNIVNLRDGGFSSFFIRPDA